MDEESTNEGIMDDNGVTRDANGTVKAGSKSPGGMSKELKSLRSKAAGYCDEAIDVLYEIMMDNNAANKDRIAAIKIMCDRGMGRVPIQKEEDGLNMEELMSRATVIVMEEGYKPRDDY